MCCESKQISMGFHFGVRQVRLLAHSGHNLRLRLSARYTTRPAANSLVEESSVLTTQSAGGWMRAACEPGGRMRYEQLHPPGNHDAASTASTVSQGDHAGCGRAVEAEDRRDAVSVGFIASDGKMLGLADRVRV